jgi:predicted transcriptional regulator
MTQAHETYHGSYLMPSFERATVADVMRPGVMSYAPDAPLVGVAQTMATHHVHSVVVAGITGDDHLVWGLVSDMDIVRAAEAGIEGHTAADAARTEVVTVDPATPLSEVVRLMDERGTAHLIVTTDGRPTCVISSLDVAGALAWGRA